MNLSKGTLAKGLILIAVVSLTADWALAQTRRGGNDRRGGSRGGGGQPRDPDNDIRPDAPTSFESITNGHISQTQFELDREVFDEQEDIDEGLGPLFNARSCGECHGNPISGGVSQVTEIRAGKFANGVFTDRAGGSLVNDRAIDNLIQERVRATDNVLALRISVNVLGDGFVEAIADSTLEAIAARQPAAVRGTVIYVPVLEAPRVTRAGRFGWKNQHASLVSFSADAYLNEMGITSPLQPVENTLTGKSVAVYDDVPDPEEAATPDEPTGPDIEAFARFMRATQPPPRAETASSTEVRDGEQVFSRIGCVQCHVSSIVTAPVGTAINGGTFVVPAALGDKTIHPYSDFLLHDVGTGDGIVQNGGAQTRNKLRTPPLWGLRTHTRMMHDGQSRTVTDAILRHAGQAQGAITSYRALSDADKQDLLKFLDSL